MSVKIQLKNEETLKIGRDKEQPERKLEKEQCLGSERVPLPSYATSVLVEENFEVGISGFGDGEGASVGPPLG